MKTCPVCHAKTFDDARICYGCLYDFAQGGRTPLRAGAQPEALETPGAGQAEAAPAPGLVFGRSAEGRTGDACAAADPLQAGPMEAALASAGASATHIGHAGADHAPGVAAGAAAALGAGSTASAVSGSIGAASAAFAGAAPASSAPVIVAPFADRVPEAAGEQPRAKVSFGCASEAPEGKDPLVLRIRWKPDSPASASAAPGEVVLGVSRGPAAGAGPEGSQLRLVIEPDSAASRVCEVRLAFARGD